MKSECSDTRETFQPHRLTQTSLQCIWEKLTTQQARLPLDQGTGSDRRIRRTGGRELSCQSRQSTNSVTSVVEYAQHDPQCLWSFTGVIVPNTLQSLYDGVAARSESVTVSHMYRALQLSIECDKDRTISFMIFIVSDKQKWNFIISLLSLSLSLSSLSLSLSLSLFSL